MLAGLAFCEMPSQYLEPAFQGRSGGPQRGQQQFANQTLRVHLLGREKTLYFKVFQSLENCLD